MAYHSHDHIVRARQPTALQGVYTLPTKDLIVSFPVDIAHVVPGPIDVPRFRDALSRTLSIYPLASGRLMPRGPDGLWKINLNNAGVALTILDAPTISAPDTVVQRPLTLIRPLDISRILASGSDEPLMRVLITRTPQPGSTAIGISSWHPIGDGYMMLRFVRTLSQFYQGLPPVDAPPVWRDLCLPEADASWELDFPSTRCTHPRGVVPAHLDPRRTPQPTRLTFRLDGEQFETLRGAVKAKGPPSSPAQLSRQDCLVAVLAQCYSQFDTSECPVDTVQVMLNVRGTGFMHADAPGNALVWASTAGKSLVDCLYTLACQIRMSILEGREPTFTAAFLARAGQVYQHTASADRVLDVAPPPGQVTVNSSFRFDWTSAHFGYPGRTRFYHTSPPAARYVKIFRPNPTPLPGGRWREGGDGVEVTTYVSACSVDSFKRGFSQMIRSLGVLGSPEWVKVS